MPLSPRQTLLKDFIDLVWSAGQIDACDRFLAESYRIEHDPGDPWDGQTLDRNGFKNRVLQSRAPFPDQRFEMLGWFENRSAVAVTWVWSATHLGDFPGFPASGRRLHMSGATQYGFNADNRITGHWQVADRLGIYHQLQGAR